MKDQPQTRVPIAVSNTAVVSADNADILRRFAGGNAAAAKHALVVIPLQGEELKYQAHRSAYSPQKRISSTAVVAAELLQLAVCGCERRKDTSSRELKE